MPNLDRRLLLALKTDVSGVYVSFKSRPDLYIFVLIITSLLNFCFLVVSCIGP